MKMYCQNCKESTKHSTKPRFWTWVFGLGLFPIGLLLFLVPRKYKCKECKTVLSK